MKNILKIIYINIIVILTILFVFEIFLAGYKYTLKYKILSKPIYSYTCKEKIIKAFELVIDLYKQNTDYFDINSFRKPVISNKKNSGILLMGCSFTYGETLKDTETFGYLLNKYTDYSIYNMGLSGGSLREMLYLFQSEKLLDEYTCNNKEIKYVIYTYIKDHLRRLYTSARPRVPRYKLNKDGRLEYLRPIVHSEFFQNIYSDNLIYIIPDKEKYKLFTAFMLQINKEIKKKYGDKTKFIIFIYDNDEIPPFSINLLENDGIRVIKTENITDIDINEDKYLSTDGYHPDKTVWDILVPPLSKVLEL